MTKELSVRRARADEACSIAALDRAVFRDAWGEDVFDGWIRSDGYCLWTAHSPTENALIGYLAVQLGPEVAEILRIAVNADQRRQGVAQGLLNTAMRDLKSANTKRLLLDVARSNTGARAFYTEAGFTEDGVRPRYYPLSSGVRDDAILMSRRL